MGGKLLNSKRDVDRPGAKLQYPTQIRVQINYLLPYRAVSRSLRRVVFWVYVNVSEYRDVPIFKVKTNLNKPQHYKA